MEENPSKWQGPMAVNTQNSQRASEGEVKLNHLIYDLQKFTFQVGNEVRKQEETSVTTIGFRRRIEIFLRQLNFHYLIILLVITDLIIVVVDLVLGMFTKRKFSN
jgi:hypothetical protein